MLRYRRNRVSDWSRNLVSDVGHISPADLILPIFIHDNESNSEIGSMRGIYRNSIKSAVRLAQKAESMGITAIMLFPCIPNALKDPTATEVLNPDCVIYRCIKEVKAATSNIGVISDVALDPYTSHGHDGILDKNNYVDNDSTVERLVQQALLAAESGADIVAPSDMMDGRVMAIRSALEANNMPNVKIMSYSAKYASTLYGSFREATGSAKKKGEPGLDKRSYQIDFRNYNDAILSTKRDIEEGADIVIVKPGIFYLDVLYRVKQSVRTPVVAYQVSNEYSMIEMVTREHGEQAFISMMMEAMISFKRAGATAVVTYAAEKIAENILST